MFKDNGVLMSVKLAILKSGEDVIADIQEMVFEEKVIGYIFNKPCAVKMRPNEDDLERGFQISLFPWLPLSRTTKVPVSVDWVVTIVDPIQTLEKMYVKDVLKNDQTIAIDEQSDSNI
jgi:hypothetical protein